MLYDYSFFYKTKDENEKFAVKKIKVDGDCTITVNQPDSQNNFVKINCQKEGTFVEYNDIMVFDLIIDLPKQTAEILSKIAALSGDTNKIEAEDLKSLQLKKGEFGLKYVNHYEDAYYSKIVFNSGEVLKIDFDREGEKTVNIEKQEQIDENYHVFLDYVPIEYQERITEIAANIGVSENIIKSLIITEGKPESRKPLLKAYYCPAGYLTIGFGHTNLCRGTDKFKIEKDTEIDLDFAFQLLEDDLNYIKKLVIKRVGGPEVYNELPASVQDACIDYAYHSGPNGNLLKDNFKEYVKTKNYTALITDCLLNLSDKRRSAYRFMLGINDLSTEDKEEAFRIINNNGMYDKISIGLIGEEKELFVQYCITIEKEEDA